MRGKRGRAQERSTHANEPPTEAQDPGADRRLARHRPRDGHALCRLGLARHQLLAASVSQGVSLGDGARRSHAGRSVRRGRHGARHRRAEGAPRGRGIRARRARQQCRRQSQGGGRRAPQLGRHRDRRLAARVPGQFLCAGHAGARTDGRARTRARAPSSTSRRSPAAACIRSPDRRTPRRRRRWRR